MGPFVSEKNVLTFDKENDSIKSDAFLGCVIYAEHAKYGRIRFSIGHGILALLSGDETFNPIHHEQNETLSETKRTDIEEACRRACNRAVSQTQEPPKFIELVENDFRQSSAS